MTAKLKSANDIPLYISCSNVSTAINKTGTWRFMRPRYVEKSAPCSAACPAGEDIARIEMLAARGQPREAAKAILAENPFPAVCGRVCFHPCENACNRRSLDQPVAVHTLERFLGDTALEQGVACGAGQPPSNGKKVAIVGSGPAGLSAAYFLLRLGFACEVFESQPEPGGLLRWGIPSYRLPADILDREIRRIENLGARIHCNTSLGQDFLQEAAREYAAVFLGCGHGQSIAMRIPGEELARDGLAYLRQLRNGESKPLTGRVAVIGGGNSAIDVARSLVRRGAEPIVVYRRRRKDMPAFKHEVQMALEEGVKLRELVAPIGIAGSADNYALTLQKMKVLNTDAGGRAKVVPDGQATETLLASRIFSAIGAEPADMWMLPAPTGNQGLTMSHCTLVAGDIPMIYGGDLTNRNKSVTDAIASGKQAAMALDTLCRSGWDAIVPRLAACQVGDGPALSMEIYQEGARKRRQPHIVSFDEINIDYFQPTPRITPSMLSAAQRMQSFAEIEATPTAQRTCEEARRCFNCGICNACDHCRLFCPEMAVTLEDGRRRINYDYCKGCGICVAECPRSAMDLEEDTE